MTSMIYENTGQVPNVMTSTGNGEGREGVWSSYMWVFALVI